MRKRLGPPPPDVSVPVWAWAVYDGKAEKPDLRTTDFRNCNYPSYCIEAEVPDRKVLLTDEPAWTTFCLNDWYAGSTKSEKEDDKLRAWYDALPEEEKTSVRRKSWEQIIGPDWKNSEDDWCCMGRYVQATFWELTKDQIISIQIFGRKEKT